MSFNDLFGKCDFIEIDVQLTKDLVPVIIHDDTLGRTSDISNIEQFEDRSPWRVSDFTEEELQSLDFGSWFNHDYEPILTLEKALLFAKEQHIFLNFKRISILLFQNADAKCLVSSTLWLHKIYFIRT